MLQDRMAKLVQHHPPNFGQRLILLRRPKATLALFSIVILNMNFCTFRVDHTKPQEPHVQKPLFSLGYKYRKPSKLAPNQ